jgi:hypothetical protein
MRQVTCVFPPIQYLHTKEAIKLQSTAEILNTLNVSQDNVFLHAAHKKLVFFFRPTLVT